MKTPSKFGNWFHIRWGEKLGRPECPYLKRWVFVLFGFSIRIHHWLQSDANTNYMHDHAFNFWSLILKGWYYNVTKGEDGSTNAMRYNAGEWLYYKAEDYHYIMLPKGGSCWTLLLCGRPFRKWGFLVRGSKWRPLRFFHKFGHMPCEQ